MKKEDIIAGSHLGYCTHPEAYIQRDYAICNDKCLSCGSNGSVCPYFRIQTKFGEISGEKCKKAYNVFFGTK
jgi:hypothetical protein